jgi:hypothetical protein
MNDLIIEYNPKDFVTKPKPKPQPKKHKGK